MANNPPLPPGFELENDTHPNLPPGFVLEAMTPEREDFSNDPRSPFLAGVGKAFTDVKLGLKQVAASIGDAIIPDSVGDTQALQRQLQQEAMSKQQQDRPLGDDPRAIAGNITGHVAMVVPALAVPGANTVTGSALVGALQGAAQPTTQPGQRLANAGTAAVLSGAGQKVSGAIASGVAKAIAKKEAAAEALKSANAAKDAIRARAAELGYVFPPSTVNPNAVNRTLESLSGKAATQQAAALQNQQITNALVRQELGLQADEPITKGALAAIRAKAGKVYAQISGSGKIRADAEYVKDLKSILVETSQIAKSFPGADLGGATQVREMIRSLSRAEFEASSAIAYIKALRKAASGNLTAAARSGDPTPRAIGQAQRDAAAALEDAVMRHLRAAGKAELADSFDGARQTIAKTYSVESALRGSDVMASKLGSQLGKGKPLSGRLKDIAEVASEFGDAVRTPKGSPGVSAFDAFIGGGGALAGAPQLLALPIGRQVARSTVLSGPYQSLLAQPSYAAGTNLLGLARSGARGLPPAASAVGLQLVGPEQE